MVYTYTPAYYSTLHDSITSLCKTILPFSFKKQRLISAEHRFAQIQSDNLKWQQDSFHQILNLMGLHKEGILSESEVSAFRTHLLDTLIASPAEQEQPAVLRDKLVFLQELLYAKCISDEEYHSSKRPLLQRLAVQGAEIDTRHVIVGGQRETKENTCEEEWSDIDLRDDKCSKETSNCRGKSANKQLKGAASVFGFVSSHKQRKSKEEKSVFEKESETKSILMQESIQNESMNENGSIEKTKRKPFKTLFQREQKEEHVGGVGSNGFERNCEAPKSSKKQWGFDGFKKWKWNNPDDDTVPLPLNSERSDGDAHSGTCNIVYSPVAEGPDTKLIKSKLHSNGSPSDFFIDKVLGDNIKKELCRIQTELGTTNPSLKFTDEQIEAISTKLPVDRAELKNFFPKSWCDRYGDVVLDVVKKEFKDHVGSTESMRNAAREKHRNMSKRWTAFNDDDDENCHPNLFAKDVQQHSFTNKRNEDTYGKGFENNPFFENGVERDGDKQRMSVSSSFQNPFWRQF